MARSYIHMALGSALLFLALGSAGCNLVLGIERLDGEGDGGLALPDAGPPADALVIVDDAGQSYEIAGHYGSLGGRLTIPADTLWAFAIDIQEAATLERVGVVLAEPSSTDVKVMVAVEHQDEVGPAEVHISEFTDSLKGSLRNELQGEDRCNVYEGRIWILMRFRIDVVLGQGATSASLPPIYRDESIAYDMGLESFPDGVSWAAGEQAQHNVYVVLSPPQTLGCEL